MCHQKVRIVFTLGCLSVRASVDSWVFFIWHFSTLKVGVFTCFNVFFLRIGDIVAYRQSSTGVRYILKAAFNLCLTTYWSWTFDPEWPPGRVIEFFKHILFSPAQRQLRYTLTTFFQLLLKQFTAMTLVISYLPLFLFPSLQIWR